MKNRNVIIAILLILFIFIGLIVFRDKNGVSEDHQDNSLLPLEEMLSMNIKSNKFENNGNIPSIYTCDGPNFNPPLQFENIPEGTKSLALIVDDPDAPSGTWTHWVLWNIAPESVAIPDDFVPEGAAEGITSFGQPGYGGPCPPDGEHRYFFKLYALDTILDLSENADAQGLRSAMKNHILEESELMGRYQRQ